MQTELNSPESKPARAFHPYWLSALFWGVFALGLLTQLLSPHLTVEHRAFSISREAFSAGQTISPYDLVARERLVQSVSAILTIGGAVGLGWCYWERLFGRSS